MSENRILHSAIRDAETVTSGGDSVRLLPAGVTVRDVITQVDQRGTVCEMFDPRWNWHPAPLVFAYTFSLRPGMVKGWGMHEGHDDRYFILFGELLLVLYDDRPDSKTRGLISTLSMSEYRRQLVNIPAGVWHANQNIGSKDVVVVNFPTAPYDHEHPDKYRLPLDTDKIPYKFEHSHGG